MTKVSRCDQGHSSNGASVQADFWCRYSGENTLQPFKLQPPTLKSSQSTGDRLGSIFLSASGSHLGQWGFAPARLANSVQVFPGLAPTQNPPVIQRFNGRGFVGRRLRFRVPPERYCDRPTFCGIAGGFSSKTSTTDAGRMPLRGEI